LQLTCGLPRLQGERLARDLGLRFLLLRFAQFAALPHYRDQLALDLLQILLAVRALRLRSWIAPDRSGAPAAASSTAASAAHPAAASRRRCGCRTRRRGSPDVADLRQHPAFERHYIEVAAAHEGDPLAVGREARRGLYLGGFGELLCFPSRVVEQEEVAGVRVDRQLLVARGVTVRRRQILDLLVGQFAKVAAVPIHRVRIHGCDDFVRIALPLKVERLAVVRPPDRRRFVAHQFGTAHDAVDRQFKIVGRAGLKHQH
jgi:hypothetical protein